MSVWFRQRPPRAERRDANTRSLAEYIAAMTSAAGFNQVDLSAAESSMQSVAVRSAVDLIASIGSELPLDIFRGRGATRTEVRMPGYLEDPDGSEQGLQDWCYRVLVSWLLRGNLYGDVLDRGPGGVLRQVDIFHPDRVKPHMEDGAVKWLVQGQEIPAGRILHRRVNPVPGWLLGLSPIEYHAWTIGLSLTSTRFGLQWFQDGAHPSGILRNSEVPLDKKQSDTAKDRFLAALRGSREPVVFGKGWEYQALQINPEDSQFLETQGFSAAECARIFGPGIAEILGYGGEGSSLTYANVTDRDLHVLKYALDKWLRRLERLLGEFLPKPQYALFNRDALLRTDTLRRYQAHASALDKQWKTPNEVRQLEDMPPVPWGYQPNAVPGAVPDEPDEPPPGDGEDDDAEGGDR